MTWCKALFDELDEGEFGSVNLADDSELAIKGMGKLTLKVAWEDGERVLRLHDVLWVPNLTSNLLSVMRAVEGDIRFEMAPGGMRMGCEGDMSVLAPHVKERGGCILTTEIKGRQATAQHVRTGGASLEARLLHQRTGHSSPKVAGVMWDKGCAKGTAVSKSALIQASHDCDDCKQGKGVRAPFPHSEAVWHRRLSLVHVDVIGPMEEGTGGDGEKYTLTIVDSASRKVWAYPMAAKGNALTVFLDWVRRAQKETGEQLVVVRSDNGGEFINRQSQDWAKELGVWWETTNPYTSQQNGVAERWNRTLQDRMRAMLLTSGLDNSYWPHAMRAAAYVLNRTPRLKDGGRIPEEIWTGRKVDLSNLRVFGCLCWPLVQSAQRKGKLALRRVPAVFLGYGETTKGWKVYIPSKSTHRMGTSRDVIFDEDRRYQDLPVPRKTGSLDDVLEWHDEWSLVEDRDEERGDQWSGEGVGAAGAEEAAGPVGVEGEGGLTKDGAQEERQADDRRVVKSAEKDAGDVAELDADAEGVGDGGEMEEDEEPDETAHLEQLLLRAQIDGLPSSEEVEEAMAPAISDPNRQAPSDPQTQPQDSPPAPTATAAPPDRIPEAERAHIKRIRESREPTRRSPRLHQQHGQAKMVRAYAMAVRGALLVGGRVSADGVPLEPKTLSEARSRPEWDKWRSAMQEEYDSLVKKKTWEKVSRRQAKRLIRSRWVYKLKLDAMGKALRHKARLVAMGNTQRAGIDYGETFSPVARMASLRILLVLAAKFGWIVEQSDVVTAYLNGVLHDTVYMEQPPGFEDGTSDVLLLRRALYGLKQSGREWNEVLVAALIKAGFAQLDSEPCIFVRNPKDWKRIVVLGVYVDDILIFTPSREECEQVKKHLRDEFEIKENGAVHHFLGVQVLRDEAAGTITLSQQAYANATLQRYGMDNAKGRDLPLPERGKGDTSDSPSVPGDYAARVGSLMWLGQCTRPDFTFPVGVLARKMGSPDEEAAQDAQQLLRHLRKTSDLKLTYKPSSDIVLEGYADADHGGDRVDMKSTTGWVFLVYGCAVSWKSQLQKTPAWSTTEAEYMALFEAAREALWIRNFLGELGMQQKAATPLYCDNEAATTIANKPAAFGKSKHFDLKYHFTRDRVRRGQLTVSRVDTDNNLADIFTKVLPRGKLEVARRRLGLSG